MTDQHPIEEQLDLYALGALEGEERRQVEAHLASCGTCARTLAEVRGVLAAVAMTAEQKTPSARAKQQLFERIGRERAAARTAGPGGFRWNFVWAAATAAFAALAVFLWVANSRLETELEGMRQAAAVQKAELDRVRAVSQMVMSPDTVAIKLAAVGPRFAGGGRVLYNARQGALIYSGSIPPAEAGKAYELWVVPQEGNPIPAGLVSVNPLGEGSVVLPRIPAGVAFKAFAITLEPAGGTPAPTGPFVQTGA